MESARLKLSEGLDLAVPPDLMWSLLTEPRTIVSCMPGAAITGERDDGAYEGTMVTKLGPTTVTFQGAVRPVFDHAQRTGSLEARGGDSRGRTKVAATVAFRLSGDDAPPRSVLSIDTEIDVTGGLAPFVRSGGQHLMTRMLAEFSTNLAALTSAVEDPGDDQAPSAQAVGSPAAAKPIPGLRLLAATIGDIVRHWLRRLTPSAGRPASGDDRSRG